MKVVENMTIYFVAVFLYIILEKMRRINLQKKASLHISVRLFLNYLVDKTVQGITGKCNTFIFHSYCNQILI